MLQKLKRRYFTEDVRDPLGGPSSDDSGPMARVSSNGKRLTDYINVVTMYKWELFQDRFKYTG